NRNITHDELRKKFVEQSKLVLDLVTATFDRVIEKPSKNFSSYTLALSITGTINAHVISWLLSGKNGNLVQAEKEILYIIFNGIRN
ncbi:MAG: hypothetical protein GWO85_01290, partial [Simkaniaceae bacterium]|nr:hypothetical protein [Simkaniaceae bacterium]